MQPLELAGVPAQEPMEHHEASMGPGPSAYGSQEQGAPLNKEPMGPLGECGAPEGLEPQIKSQWSPT